MTEDDVPQAGEAIDTLVPLGVDEHRATDANPHAADSMNGGIVLRVDQRGEIAREKLVQN